MGHQIKLARELLQLPNMKASPKRSKTAISSCQECFRRGGMSNGREVTLQIPTSAGKCWVTHKNLFNSGNSVILCSKERDKRESIVMSGGWKGQSAFQPGGCDIYTFPHHRIAVHPATSHLIPGCLHQLVVKPQTITSMPKAGLCTSKMVAIGPLRCFCNN